MKLQVPFAATVVVPMDAPSTRTVMVVPGSPLPTTTGVVVLTRLPFEGLSTTGVSGGVVSMVKRTGVLSRELPTTFTDDAVATCGPALSAVEAVQENAPAEVAVAVQTTTPSTRTETALPASAVPENTVSVTLLELPSTGAVSTGTAGAAVRTVKSFTLETAETFPAASVAVADAVCAPAASGVVGVKLQAPVPSAVAVPTDAPSTSTVTVEFASAVPEMAGCAEVYAPWAGAVTTGAAGGVMSIVKVLVAEAAETFPAASVAVALTV